MVPRAVVLLLSSATMSLHAHPASIPPVYDSLKALHLNTALVENGRAAATIVVPSNGVYDAQAAGIQRAILERTGVKVPLARACRWAGRWRSVLERPFRHRKSSRSSKPGRPPRVTGPWGISGGTARPRRRDSWWHWIRVLAERNRQTGYYQITWDGKDDSGREVSSGVYCSRLEVDGGKFTAVRKMVLLK